MYGGEVTGSKRRGRVPIRKDRRGSQITRGEERKDLSNGGRTKQSKSIKLTTENTLKKETDHGDKGYSGVDINKEAKKEEADIYILGKAVKVMNI